MCGIAKFVPIKMTEIDREEQIDEEICALSRHYVTERRNDCMDVSSIDDRLWLGGYQLAACVKEAILMSGITHILTVGHNMPRPFESHIVYKIFEVYDNNEESIEHYFDECFKFIDDALRDPKNQVLIHCWAGKSRSVTIMAYYLMRSKGLTYWEALETIRSARFFINPNNGFRKKLKQAFYDRRDIVKEQIYEVCEKILAEMYSRKSDLSILDFNKVCMGFDTVFGSTSHHTMNIRNVSESPCYIYFIECDCLRRWNHFWQTTSETIGKLILKSDGHFSTVFLNLEDTISMSFNLLSNSECTLFFFFVALTALMVLCLICLTRFETTSKVSVFRSNTSAYFFIHTLVSFLSSNLTEESNFCSLTDVEVSIDANEHKNDRQKTLRMRSFYCLLYFSTTNIFLNIVIHGNYTHLFQFSFDILDSSIGFHETKEVPSQDDQQCHDGTNDRDGNEDLKKININTYLMND